MSNTLITMTGSAAPTQGHTYAEADKMLTLYNAVVKSSATAQIMDRMFEILGAAQPITASILRTMHHVRADEADIFWKDKAPRGDDADVAEDDNGGEFSLTPAVGRQLKADKAARKVLREIVEGS